FVWDVDHVATLRSEHHICGVLSGTLPHLSQQNVFLGLPMVLIPEELVLLSKSLATIVYDPAAHRAPHPHNSKRGMHPASRSGDVDSQKLQLRQQQRRTREKRAGAGDHRKSSRSDEREDVPVTPIPLQTQRESPTSEPVSSPLPTATPTPISGVVYTVSVPTTSDDFAWYDSTAVAHTYETLDAARAANVWNYPATPEDRARCEVFRDLWEKGYYMGGGSKFGGDWLVYPGDPLRYHSHFVATVQTSPFAPLRPMEVVAHGRLGTATKKAHLLCGWDPVSREVTYITIEWAGFG
ncbi:tRNA intron endonuclease, partial [Lactifluus volemus]